MISITEGTPSGPNAVNSWDYQQVQVRHDPIAKLNFYEIAAGGHLKQVVTSTVTAPNELATTITYRTESAALRGAVFMRLTARHEDKEDINESILLVPLKIERKWQTVDSTLPLKFTTGKMQLEIINYGADKLHVTMLGLSAQIESGDSEYDMNRFIELSFTYGLDDDKPNLREAITNGDKTKT